MISMDSTSDKFERRRLQNRNAQRRFRWKKEFQDPQSNVASQERVSHDDTSPTPLRARFATQAGDDNGNGSGKGKGKAKAKAKAKATSSPAQLTSDMKQRMASEELSAHSTYPWQNRHSPSLASTSSSSSPLVATPNSDMTPQRQSGDRRVGNLSQNDHYMMAPSLTLMPTLFQPDFASSSALGNLLDPLMFVESPVAGTNKHMAAVRSHGPSTHLNSSSGMCDYKSAYDLSSLGNWGDEAAISQTREHRPSLSHTQIAQSSRRSNCSKDKTKGGGEVDNENRQPSPAGADRFYSDEASQATYQTSLHIAAEHGQESVVGIILASGVMVDEPDSEGNTALHLATQTQQLDVVLRLLEHGANPNATNMRGWTPVHLGISTGSLDIVQALVNHGGDLSRRAKCKK